MAHHGYAQTKRDLAAFLESFGSGESGRRGLVEWENDRIMPNAAPHSRMQGGARSLQVPQRGAIL